MKTKLERKDLPFDVKKTDDTDPDFFFFEGYASTFGNIDLGGDIIVEGAFKKSLDERTPKILWQHMSMEPIGMPDKVFEDSKGLFIRGKLPKADTLVSGRVIPQFKVGSISAMSIGFRVVQDEIREDGVRLLKQLDLREFSPITFPMNELATVSSFKSLIDEAELDDQQKKLFLTLYRKSLADGEPLAEVINVEAVKALTRRQLERSLRDSGCFSKDAAVYIVKDFAGQGEPVGDDESETMKALNDVLGLIDKAEVETEIARELSRINS